MIKRPLRNLTAASILAGATHGAIAQRPMPQTPSTKAADDSETGPRRAAFLQGLQELGRSEGRNLRIDYRWGVGDNDRHRANAAELAALGPDVILAHGSPIVRQLQRATRTVPIVFVSVADPV